MRFLPWICWVEHARHHLSAGNEDEEFGASVRFADEDGAVSIMEAATYIEDSIWDFFDAWGWDQSTRQIIQAYPENCAWFAPFRN